MVEELARVDQFLSQEKYEETQDKVEKINSLITEKEEFLHWIGLKLTSVAYQVEVNEYQARSTTGQYPAQLSEGNKRFLVLCRDINHMEILDLETGQSFEEPLPVEGTLKAEADGYMWVDPIGGAFVRVWEPSAGQFRIYYSHKSSSGYVSDFSAAPPLIFAGNKGDTTMLGSYDLTTPSGMDSGFKEGERFSLPDLYDRNRKLKKMNITNDGQKTYTLDDKNNVAVWDNQFCGYTGALALLAIDFRLLSDGKVIVLEKDNKISCFDDSNGIMSVDLPEMEIDKIAVNPEGKSLIVLEKNMTINIFRIGSWEKIAQIDLRKFFQDPDSETIEFIDVGKDDRVILGLNDGLVLILADPKERNA